MKLIKLLLAILTSTAAVNIAAVNDSLYHREILKNPVIIFVNFGYTLIAASVAYLCLINDEQQSPKDKCDSQSALTEWRTIQKLRLKLSESNSLTEKNQVISELNTSYINLAIAISAGVYCAATASGLAWITARGIMDNIQTIAN